ncbi:MAG: TIGR02646 family protein [Lachnospiraceae bacterium]|nr:TIGR02646 family protein [Lachnospiraceae bacterium]
MNYIVRMKDKLDKLSETDKEFKQCIKGMTKEQAYQFFKAHKGVYLYNTEETKAEFAKMTGRRCSFCTKQISDFHTEMTVEHIETKQDCPEKIYQWDNLLCACRSCNTKRSTKKYLADKYLDPAKVKDIERYFCFRADGSISADKTLSAAETKKAEYMIELYQLDREDLDTERREFFNNLMDDEYFQILERRSKDSQDIHFWSVFAYYKRRMEDGK